MKEKPLSLKYFSISFVFIAFVATLEFLFSWKLEIAKSLQLYSLAFVVLGLWGARSAQQASASLFAVLAFFWTFVGAGYLLHLKELSINDYQLFAFYISVSLIALQSIWFLSSFAKIVVQPTKQWWKTPRRVSVALDAIVRTDNGKSYVAEIHNMSKGGFLLSLKGQEEALNFKPGEPMKIHFVLQSSRYVRCSAVVVHNRVSTYGLKITRIDSPSRRNIEHFVARAS